MIGGRWPVIWSMLHGDGAAGPPWATALADGVRSLPLQAPGYRYQAPFTGLFSISDSRFLVFLFTINSQLRHARLVDWGHRKQNPVD